MDILFLIIGLAVGAVVGWLMSRSKKDGLGIPQEIHNELQIEKSRLEERLDNSIIKFKELEAGLDEKTTSEKGLLERVTRSETLNQNLQEKLSEHKKELTELHQQLKDQFEAIASKVLRQSSEDISRINREKLDETLKPLGERIKNFEQKIDQSAKERNTLQGEINKMFELNQRMAEEAHNLTKALKGDSKKQGNWGEVILERILESSGLIKDREYKLQYNTENADGNRILPDAIIFLPDEKHLIIDSKVSLVAYEKLVNEEDDSHKEQHAKAHVLSIRTHIKQLSEKSYQSSKDLNSPDFVLMFMPIEAAFSMAIQYDHQLFSDAWDKKIVIVSPTTLLATLQTISSVWKQERQTKNAITIAEESGKLYDKFVGFLSDLEGVGKHLQGSQNAYDEALKKLKYGKGDLIGRVENLKKLGAKATKTIPENFKEGDSSQQEIE